MNKYPNSLDSFEDIFERMHSDRPKINNKKTRLKFFEKIIEEFEEIKENGDRKIKKLDDMGRKICRITPLDYIDYRFLDAYEPAPIGKGYLSRINKSYIKRKLKIPRYLTDLSDTQLVELFVRIVSYKVARYYLDKGFKVYEEEVPAHLHNDTDETTRINFITVSW